MSCGRHVRFLSKFGTCVPCISAVSIICTTVAVLIITKLNTLQCKPMTKSSECEFRRKYRFCLPDSKSDISKQLNEAYSKSRAKSGVNLVGPSIYVCLRDPLDGRSPAQELHKSHQPNLSSPQQPWPAYRHSLLRLGSPFYENCPTSGIFPGQSPATSRWPRLCAYRPLSWAMSCETRLTLDSGHSR
jgi:hypothetical protein